MKPSLKLRINYYLYIIFVWGFGATLFYYLLTYVNQYFLLGYGWEIILIISVPLGSIWIIIGWITIRNEDKREAGKRAIDRAVEQVLNYGPLFLKKNRNK